MRANSFSLGRTVAVLLLLFVSSTLAGFSVRNARAQAGGPSQWTGSWDTTGTTTLPGIPGPLNAKDGGTFNFEITPASSGGSGSGSGHFYLSGEINGCTFVGDTAYTFSLDAVYDPSSGNVTLTGSSPIPPTYDVTETCVPTGSGMFQFDTPIIPLASGVDVKLEDGATWQVSATLGLTTVQATGNIHGADLPLNPVNIDIASPTEGITQSNFVVGQFNDTAGSSASASDFTAVINWGDGSPDSSGSVVGDARAGLFNVTGSHLYAEAEKFSVSVKVGDSDGSGVTLHNSLGVQDADIKAADINSFVATPGVEFSGAIAKFSDGNPTAPASDYTITITWGDGTANSSGVAVPGGVLGRSIFNITGTHTYVSSGTYSVSAKIVDKESEIETANSTAYIGVTPPNTTETTTGSSTEAAQSPQTGPNLLTQPITLASIAAVAVIATIAALFFRRRSH
jgi:hypothetical protein